MDEWIWRWEGCCCSLAKSCPTLCDPMDTRLLCLPPSPGVFSNWCPLSYWCYLTISSSVTPFSFGLQSFPASEYFSVSQLFASRGESIGASSFSIIPFNEYSGLISFRIDWFHLLDVQGTLKSHLKSPLVQMGIFKLMWPRDIPSFWALHSLLWVNKEFPLVAVPLHTLTTAGNFSRWDFIPWTNYIDFSVSLQLLEIHTWNMEISSTFSESAHWWWLMLSHHVQLFANLHRL